MVASRLRIKEFYAVGSEWNDDGTRLGVVNNVCDGMAAKLNASAELPALRAGGLLELTYESLLASPLQRIAERVFEVGDRHLEARKSCSRPLP